MQCCKAFSAFGSVMFIVFKISSAENLPHAWMWRLKHHFMKDFRLVCSNGESSFRDQSCMAWFWTKNSRSMALLPCQAEILWEALAKIFLEEESVPFEFVLISVCNRCYLSYAVPIRLFPGNLVHDTPMDSCLQAWFSMFFPWFSLICYFLQAMLPWFCLYFSVPRIPAGNCPLSGCTPCANWSSSPKFWPLQPDLRCCQVLPVKYGNLAGKKYGKWWS